MVSSKERVRFAAMFDKANGAIQRQKKAITRLLAFNQEAIAALLEIRDMPPGDRAATNMRERAQAAIERIERMAAAVESDQAESTGEEIPAVSEEGEANG